MTVAAALRAAPEDLRPGDVDLSDPRTFLAEVPNEYFRVLREHDPVHWQAERTLTGFLPSPGYWALTRYEDVAFVSKHPEIFSTERGTSSLNDLPPRLRRLAYDQLIQMDPPGHTELRNLMNVQFKPSAVRETEAHMRKVVRETLEHLEGRSEFDFVEGVSAPISLRILTNFLGVPDEYTARPVTGLPLGI